MWRPILGLALLIFPFLPGTAQDTDLSGLWRGVLTQRPEGVASEYAFEMYVVQDGQDVTGRTYVWFQDYEASLDIEGKVVRGQALLFRETNFVFSSELEETLTWCKKSGQLIVKEEDGVVTLEGVWQGKTEDGPCVPGKIRLQRVVPQA